MDWESIIVRVDRVPSELGFVSDISNLKGLLGRMHWNWQNEVEISCCFCVIVKRFLGIAATKASIEGIEVSWCKADLLQRFVDMN